MNVKKITLGLAIAATALALFACNKQPKEIATTEPTQAETAADTQTVAAEAEAAAQGTGTDAQPPAIESSTQEPAANDGADGEKAEDKVSEDQKY